MTNRGSTPCTNFAIGSLVQRYFDDDPNTTLLKLRQLAELVAQLVATGVGLYTSHEGAQYDLLRRVEDKGILPRELAAVPSRGFETELAEEPRKADAARRIRRYRAVRHLAQVAR